MGDFMDAKKRIVIFLIVAMLIMIPVISVYIQHTDSQKSIEKITAMNGKSMADKIAFEWNNSATFVGGGLCGEINNEGRATCWTFAYQNNMNGNGTYEFNVKVYYNGENKTEILWLNAPTSTGRIEEWTIDSDKAYSIALKNESIKAFLDKYPDAEVDLFSLSSGNSSHPVWTIAWVDWGFWDDPHWAKIQIDATTGDVLSADANIGSAMTASTIYTLCILSIMLPIIVIIAVVLWLFRKKHGRNGKGNPNKEEPIYKRDEENGR